MCTWVSTSKKKNKKKTHHFRLIISSGIMASNLGFTGKTNVFLGCNNFKATRNIHPECLCLSLSVQMMTIIAAEIWMDCMSSIVFVSLILMIALVQGHPVSDPPSVIHTELHTVSPQAFLFEFGRVLPAEAISNRLTLWKTHRNTCMVTERFGV